MPSRWGLEYDYCIASRKGSFILVLWHINHCILFNAKSIFIHIHIKNSISTNSIQHKYTVWMSKTVLFQTIQFSITTQFSFIWPIDRTLSGATTPRQSGPGSNGNKGLLCSLQSSSINGVSLSDWLSPGHLLRWGGGLTSLQRCSWCILQL